VRAHGIHVTPLQLVEGERTYRDGIDITATEFHQRLREGRELPTTSQPAPAAFLETYARAFEEAETVVAVLVSSTLSGTLAAGEMAASRAHGGSVHVVDSLGASLLQGLLVLKAAELAELGSPPAEIFAELKRVRARSGIVFTPGDLDRLVASGRVTRGQALVGRALSLRPILGLAPDGAVARLGTAVGSRRARAGVLSVVRRQIPRGAKHLRFGIVHVGTPEAADEIERELRAEYGEHVDVLAAPVTPVIATHTGVGTVGVAYLVED
jgi:DegV family protein with EDD domain